jgi:hypothetical protein
MFAMIRHVRRQWPLFHDAALDANLLRHHMAINGAFGGG